MAPPAVRVVIVHTPATGATEIQFDAGGQAFVAQLLLDCVAQLAQEMVPKNPQDDRPTQGAELHAIATYMCAAVNRFLVENLKPSAVVVPRLVGIP
jgi:hypothetical protein